MRMDRSHGDIAPPRKIDLESSLAAAANAVEVARILQQSDPDAAADVLRIAARRVLALLK